MADSSAVMAGFLEYDLTFILLLLSVLIFGLLAWRSKNVRTFQFQISIFILIWISGELVNALAENGYLSLTSSMKSIGYEIHLVSMIFFAVLLYTRYFYSRERGLKLMDNINE